MMFDPGLRHTMQQIGLEASSYCDDQAAAFGVEGMH